MKRSWLDDFKAAHMLETLNDEPPRKRQKILTPVPLIRCPLTPYQRLLNCLDLDQYDGLTKVHRFSKTFITRTYILGNFINHSCDETILIYTNIFKTNDYGTKCWNKLLKKRKYDQACEILAKQTLIDIPRHFRTRILNKLFRFEDEINYVCYVNTFSFLFFSFLFFSSVCARII